MMANAQEEEFKHFGMDIELLLRQTPKWRAALERILFSDSDIVVAGNGVNTPKMRLERERMIGNAAAAAERRRSRPERSLWRPATRPRRGKLAIRLAWQSAHAIRPIRATINLSQNSDNRDHDTDDHRHSPSRT